MIALGLVSGLAFTVVQYSGVKSTLTFTTEIVSQLYSLTSEERGVGYGIFVGELFVRGFWDRRGRGLSLERSRTLFVHNDFSEVIIFLT